MKNGGLNSVEPLAGMLQVSMLHNEKIEVICFLKKYPEEVIVIEDTYEDIIVIEDSV